MTLLIQTSTPLLAHQIEEGLAEHCPAAKVIGTCYSTAAGMAAAKALHPDAVLLDLDMPRVIKEGVRTELLLAGYRVISLTANEKRHKKMLAQGAEVVLSKPLEMVKLTSLLMEA